MRGHFAIVFTNVKCPRYQGAGRFTGGAAAPARLIAANARNTRWQPGRNRGPGHGADQVRSGPGPGQISRQEKRIGGPWVCFRGSEFWSTPRHGPDGTGPPALPAAASTGIPGIPGIQGSSPPRPLTPGGSGKTIRHPPHSSGNAPVAHGCLSFQVTGGLCFRRPLPARPARSPLTPRNPHITHTGPSARAGRRPQARRRPGAGARTTAQELRRGSPPRQGRPAAPARRAVPGSGGTLRSQNNSRVPPPPARDPPRPASLPKKGTRGPSLSLPGLRLPHRCPIDAAATATRGHRCRCRPAGSSNAGTSLRPGPASCGKYPECREYRNAENTGMPR